MKRYVITNNLTERDIISNDLKKYEGKFESITEDEFISQLPKMTDSLILGYGYELYQRLRQLHTDGIIHIGLRRFNYNDFKNLQIVHIGNNKLVFGAYPVVGTELVYFNDGSCSYCDPKLNYFFSDAVNVDPLPLPEVQLVGLREGIEVLKNEFLTNIGEDVGFDFESSGFPQDYGFKVSGFSLSSKTRMKAWFFDFRKDYDYLNSNITQETLDTYQEFMKLAYEYLKSNAKHVWTYNCTFEIHACLMLFHDFIELQDAYALCIADDLRGSLKYNVQYYLKSPSWDDMLDKQQEYIAQICESDYGFNNYDEFKTALDNWDVVDGSGDYVICDYKRHEFLNEAMENYKANPNWLPMLKEYWGDTWFACDPVQLGTYCCYDSYYTVALTELLYPIYGENCYKTFLYCRYLGVELKTHGIVIDTERRDKLDKFCTNIPNNFNIYMNKLLLNFRKNKLKYKYDKYELNDVQKKLFGVIDTGVTFDQGMLSTDMVYVGKSIILASLPQSYIDIMNKGEAIPTDFLNKLLGIDFSDELNTLNTYNWNNYDTFTRKRSMFKYVGKLLYEMCGLKELRLKLNEDNFKLIKDEYSQWIDEVTSKWVLESTIPIKSGKVKKFIDMYDWCKTSYEKYLAKGQIEGPFIEYVNSYMTDDFEFIKLTEIDCQILNNLPSEIRDMINMTYPLTSDLSINPMAAEDLSYWIPQFILDKHKDLVSVYELYDYYMAKNESVKLATINGNILEDQGHADELGKYYNYFSPQQLIQFKEEIADYYSKWSYLNHIILEEFSNKGKECSKDDYYELTKNCIGLMDTPQFLQSQAYVDGLTNPVIDDVAWLTAGYYTRDEMTTELDEDNCLNQLAKMSAIKKIADVTRKIQSNYITALHETAVKPHQVFNKICQFDYVDTYNSKETDLRLLYDYGINRMETKRTGSGYHTWRGYSDYNYCLKVEDGYVCTYFDISQAEPRSIAYLSEDPSFKGSYESGKDAYMELAKITWPDEVGQDYFRSYYRPIAKTSLIAKIYGRGDAGLAEMCGVEPEVVEKMGKVLFNNWKNVGKLREHKLFYTEKTGYVETYLGDRLSGDSNRAFTTAVNYPTQGNTACLLMEGFENSIVNIRKQGYEIYTQTIIHDSNTNMIRIEDLPEIDLCYRRYFRKYLKEKYQVDYKYDVDLLVNFRDHISYRLDIDTHTVSLEGPEDCIRYLVDHFKAKRNITIISSELTENTVNHYDAFLSNSWKQHVLCNDPEFNNLNTLAVSFIINEPIKGEELINEPVGEPYYFDKVKKWYEHPTPGYEAEELEQWGVKDNPNKVYPAEMANKIFGRR